MLLNAMVTAFTVSELLRETQHGNPPPRLRLIKVFITGIIVQFLQEFAMFL